MKLNEARRFMELTKDSSLDEINKRYRHMARRFHPDKGIEKSHEKFTQLQEAYELCKKFCGFEDIIELSSEIVPSQKSSSVSEDTGESLSDGDLEEGLDGDILGDFSFQINDESDDVSSSSSSESTAEMTSTSSESSTTSESSTSSESSESSSDSTSTAKRRTRAEFKKLHKLERQSRRIKKKIKRSSDAVEKAQKKLAELMKQYEKIEKKIKR